MPGGDATFSVHLVSELPRGEGIHAYFECEGLDYFVQSLLDKGIHFDQLPTDEPWLWREARLKDPDGNLLVLFWGGDNRKNPPWRLSDV